MNGIRVDPRIGMLQFHSSLQSPAHLLQLPDGRQLQVSHELYQVIDLLDGTRSTAEVATVLASRWGLPIASRDVERIVSEKLVPRGIIPRGETDSSELTQAPTSRSTLALRLKLPLVRARRIRPLTDLTQHLFSPYAAICGLAAATLVHVLTYTTLQSEFGWFDLSRIPGGALGALILLSMVGSGIHELGHFSACWRYRCEPEAIGIGIYILYPVFYADVSAAWRLPRWQRSVVDVGGMYFQLLFSILLFLHHRLTGDTISLWSIVLIDATIISNLNPLLKWDGYWLLSDAFGLPNLHQRTGDFLKQLFARLLLRGGGGRDGGAGAFLDVQPYAKLVLAPYALGCLAYFGYFGWTLLWLAPAALRSYPHVVAQAASAIAAAWSRGDVMGLGAALLQLLGPTAFVVGFAFMLPAMGWRIAGPPILRGLKRLTRRPDTTAHDMSAGAAISHENR